MSKKAQGLSMNVIIIAAIALLVLVILAVIFIGRMGKTAKSIDECPGSCEASEQDCYDKGAYFKPTSDPCFDRITGEERPDLICCVGVGQQGQ